jgi:hypothetical protein
MADNLQIVLSEIEFSLSLLRISQPGQTDSAQIEQIQELIWPRIHTNQHK